ncbi:MAG: Gfo/Idh/MocA family protein [Planctomycetota bacterium]
MTNPKVVVIGYGFAGKSFHSYLIGLAPGLDLHGISSRSEETRQKIREERGCRAYSGFEQVLGDPEVDLVVLATPHDLHCEQAVRALDAGKHVVTDKPMCTSLEQCDRMIEAAERNDRLLTVFQNRRWDGDFLTLKKLLEDGELGDLRWLEMAWQTFRSPGGWRAKKEHGGGRLFDLGAHMIDQCMLLFPQAVETVYCRMHYDYEDPEVTCESHAMVVIGFEGGNTAVVDAGGMHAIPKPRIHAFGREGAFRKYGLDPQERAMIDGDIDAAEEPEANYGTLKTEEDHRTVPTLPGRWRSFYENVAAVLAGREEPAVRLPEVRRDMAVIDAALRSARRDRIIRPEVPALED